MALRMFGLKLSGIQIVPYVIPPRRSPPPPSRTRFWAEYIRDTFSSRGYITRNINNQVVTFTNVWNLLSSLIIKQDSFGNVISGQEIRYDSISNVNDTGISSSTTDDSGNIFVCNYVTTYTLNPIVFTRNSLIHKFDNFGNLLWTTGINNNASDFYTKSIDYLNGFLYILSINSINSLSQTFIISKIDSNSGEIIWSKGISPQDSIIKNIANPSMCIDDAGDIIIASRIGIVGVPSYFTLWISKLSSIDGTFIWQQEMENPTSLGAGITSIDTDEFNNIYIAGGFDINNLIFKLDSNGSMIWTFISPEINDIEYSGGFIYTVGTEAFSEIVILKIDADNGSLVWNNNFTYPGTSLMQENITVDDLNECFIISGVITHNSGSQRNTMVMRQSTNGESGSFMLDDDEFTFLMDTKELISTTLPNFISSDAIIEDYSFNFPVLVPNIVDYIPNKGIESTNEGPPQAIVINGPLDVIGSVEVGETVIYKWIPDFSYFDTSISLVDPITNFDTVLAVYASDGTTELGYNDDYVGVQSQINGLNIVSGETYYIHVGSFSSSSSGNYRLYSIVPA